MKINLKLILTIKKIIFNNILKIMNEFTSIIVSFGITIGFIITIQLQKKLVSKLNYP